LKDKNFIQNSDKIKQLNQTYAGDTINTKNPLKKLVLRTGRKMTFWYVNPFGTSQNEFNNNVSKAFQDTNSTLEDFNSKINNLETKLASVVQQNEALKTRINALQKNDLMIVDSCIKSCSDNTKLINDYIRKVNPEMREGINPNEYKEISSQILTDATTLVRNKKVDEIDFNAWEKSYKETLKKELQNISIAGTKRIIAVVCVGFLKSLGMEAVRNEAFELYRLLKKSSVYNIKFISMEPDLENPIFDGDFLCVPSKGGGKYINLINPTLCVFCESTANILRMDDWSLILRKGILKLSGQNPVRGIPKNLLDELCHLNDFGVHKYLVESKKASQILVENGFHEPTISYPVVSKNKIFSNRKRVFNKDNFTVGFASSPMTEEQGSFRGVDLLVETVKNSPNVKFKILWRYDTATIPEELKQAENCSIEYGRINMEKFYSEIDCVLIPYAHVDFNHACSLSALESMMSNIPVVCTDVSGISELVELCNMGEVAKTDSQSICEAIQKVRNSYSMYINHPGYRTLESCLDTSNLVDIIERATEEPYPKGVVTLRRWNNELKKVDKYLVKGHDSMVEYYQQQEVAKKYTQQRFTTYALKCFDFMERQNIDIILEDRFENNRNLNILDVACGDGRITQECIKYGKCKSIDSSLAMLDIVKDRFKDVPTPPETAQVDFITDTLDNSFDVITCFRYIRHFEYSTRKQLYKKFASNLSDNGILIFDVPNIKFELALKNTAGWQNYNIYDVFWTKESIIEELKNNGFKVKYIIPTGQGLMSNVPENARNLPMTWTIGAIKI